MSLSIGELICYALITFAQITVGFLSANRCLAPKGSKRVFGYVFFGVILLVNAGIFILRYFTKSFTFLNIAALYFIPFYIMNEGPFSHKALVYVTQYYVPISLFMVASFISEIFFGYETTPYFILVAAITLCVYLLYFLMHVKYARRVCDRLFSFTRPGLWGVYLVIPFVCLFITGYFYFGGDVIWHPRRIDISLPYFMLPIFMLFCYAFLIAAILRAHDHAEALREADFARDIISSGQEHYQKMNEQYDAIRIMKHDYKFHLSAALDMLRRGEIEKSGEYLTGLRAEMSNYDLPDYCSNLVINSLVNDYAERCGKAGIEHAINISMPDGLTVPNYDMCIILGNLLENAMEACKKLSKDRRLQLVIKQQGEQLAVMVRNNYTGSVRADGTQLASTKKDGGLGLRSVQAVVTRHGGRLVTEHDGEWFKAFVLLRIK